MMDKTIQEEMEEFIESEATERYYIKSENRRLAKRPAFILLGGMFRPKTGFELAFANLGTHKFKRKRDIESFLQEFADKAKTPIKIYKGCGLSKLLVAQTN